MPITKLTKILDRDWFYAPVCHVIVVHECSITGIPLQLHSLSLKSLKKVVKIKQTVYDSLFQISSRAKLRGDLERSSFNIPQLNSRS